MKVVTLNIWGGRIHKPFLDFLKKYSEEVDVFCFQEVFDNPLARRLRLYNDSRQNINKDIKRVLSGFNGWLVPLHDRGENLAIYVKKSLHVKVARDVFVYRWKNAMIGSDFSTHGVNLQYIQVKHHDKTYTICNLHGHWTPNNKGDTAVRLLQSENINKFIDLIPGPKILVGDFNFSPDTKAMAILETRMRNLVKEYGVTSTRSRLHVRNELKFADYIMTSPEVGVVDFKVLPDVASDHLGLMLEFE